MKTLLAKISIKRVILKGIGWYTLETNHSNVNYATKDLLNLLSLQRHALRHTGDMPFKCKDLITLVVLKGTYDFILEICYLNVHYVKKDLLILVILSNTCYFILETDHFNVKCVTKDLLYLLT